MLCTRAMTLLTLTLMFMNLHMSQATAGQGNGALRVPVQCEFLPSCGSTITLAQAQSTFTKMHEAALQMPIAKATLPAKDELNIKRITESLREPVYGPLVSEHVCDAKDVIGHYYFWAPAIKVRGGAAALKQLNHDVASGRTKGSFIHVEASHSTPAERHLALCHVVHINGRTGTPRHCTTVAIVTDNDAWLRMGNTGQSWCLMSGSFRSSGAMSIKFNVKTTGGPQSLSDSIQKLLQEELILAVERSVQQSINGTIESITLRSTSGLRDSKLLPAGWRETLDFDVSISRASGHLEVHGTAHTMVSRQAVGNFTDLVGLDDAQRTLFVNGLDARIERAIKRTCNTFAKLDSTNVVCN